MAVLGGRQREASGRSSMPMGMMFVGDVGVRMTERRVAMNVAVRAVRHAIVGVVMMAVIVRMRMLVLHLFVLVVMLMSFGEVQDDPGDHERGAAEHPEAGATLA